ncbi:hypothetical protein Bbelb_336180 [Branchiostoma belcheri]|nr:hypothetical protein Bbelb_336180 [Branchiostoma belcheri]
MRPTGKITQRNRKKRRHATEGRHDRKATHCIGKEKKPRQRVRDSIQAVISKQFRVGPKYYTEETVKIRVLDLPSSEFEQARHCLAVRSSWFRTELVVRTHIKPHYENPRRALLGKRTPISFPARSLLTSFNQSEAAQTLSFPASRPGRVCPSLPPCGRTERSRVFAMASGGKQQRRLRAVLAALAALSAVHAERTPRQAVAPPKARRLMPDDMCSRVCPS